MLWHREASRGCSEGSSGPSESICGGGLNIHLTRRSLITHNSRSRYDTALPSCPNSIGSGTV